VIACLSALLMNYVLRMKKKKAGIIGAGIGGLSLAVRLAAMGVDVSVFEQNSTVGGKVNTIEKNGFKFGTGASLLTMPFINEDLMNRLKTILSLINSTFSVSIISPTLK
jgi:phytoene dehydrogenase-like protein